MDVQVLTTFFMWCLIINGGLLLLSFLICAFAGDWVYRLHGKWYPMPRETFNVAIYSFFGVFKILFWVLNATPYIALLIIA